jgi:hypothetical protein
MIMKQILGVYGKTPNLAIHAEPLCFKAFKLSKLNIVFSFTDFPQERQF